MKTLGLGAGVVAGQKIDDAIDSLKPGTADWLKDSQQTIGLLKIAIGALAPEFLKGKSKSNSINQLITPFADGLIASGALTLAKEYKVITGITGGNDYIMLPENNGNYKGGVGAIEKY